MIELLLIVPIVFLIFYYDRKPYAKIINTWCNLFHLQVIYRDRHREIFEIDVVDQVLYISRYNKATHTKEEYLYSIAHEFGHLVDYIYRDYYNKHMKDELSPQAIYNDEVRAWKIARILLQEAGHLDKKLFDSIKNKNLNDYKKALELGDD